MTAGDGRVAVAVVGDGQPGLPGLVLQVQPGLGRAGVADHVPQALLGDLEQRVLDLGGELALTAADADRYPQEARGAEVGGQVTQRLPQTQAGTLKLGQLSDGRTDPAQARAGQLLAGHQPRVRRQGRIEVPVTPFQVHPDPDQALRDAVVQVAGDPVPFGADQLGLPGPGQLSTGPAELLVAAGQFLGVPLSLGPAGLGLPAQVLAAGEQPGVPQRGHDLVRHRLQDRHPDPVRVGRMLGADQQRPDLPVIEPHRGAQHGGLRRAVAGHHDLGRVRDPRGQGGHIRRRGGTPALARLPAPGERRRDRGR